MISNITDLETLQHEKYRLQAEVDETKANLMYELLQLELSLTPSNVVIEVAKKILSPPNSMAGNMITNTIGNFAASTLFGGYSWPVRWLLRTATRNLTSNLIVKNLPTIIEKAGGLFKKKNKDESFLKQ